MNAALPMVPVRGRKEPGVESGGKLRFPARFHISFSKGPSMSRSFATVGCVLSLIFASVGVVSAALPYIFTDLGALLPPVPSYGYNMTTGGAVVGMYGTGSTTTQTFLYSGGTMITLSDGTFRDSVGYGANSSGQVAGGVDIYSGTLNPPLDYPCFWSSSSSAPINLGLLPGANSNGYGYSDAVSNSGQVVGYVSGSGGAFHAFLWTSGGGMVDLGVGRADAIDSATGHIVGGGSAGYPCFFSASNPGTETVLGNMPGGGAALGLNDSDEVVGVYTDTATHAFLWTNANGGTTTNIGATLPLDSFSKAFDINDDGQAVGEYRLADGATYHAFLYDATTGTSVDLNNAAIVGMPAGFTLQQGRAIDGAGQITGLGVNAGGVYDAFLLTPALPGDANLDGKVDINDLTIVLAHYGQNGMTWSQGAMDGDPAGTVDINDLTIVLRTTATALARRQPASMRSRSRARCCSWPAPWPAC